LQVRLPSATYNAPDLVGYDSLLQMIMAVWALFENFILLQKNAISFHSPLQI
jgi:hypothetical protein